MRPNGLFHGAALYSLVFAGAAPRAEVVPNHEERQIGGALQCLVGGIVVLLQQLLTSADAVTYCQAFLGIGTATISSTTEVTVSITNTHFVTTGTYFFTVTAPIVTNTIVSIGATYTSCLSTGRLAKRQTSAPTLSALAELSPASISLLCACLNPPTPTTTAIVTKTASLTVQASVHLAASVSLTVTPTVTVTTTSASIVNFCPIPTIPPVTCSNAGLQWAYWPDRSLEFASFPASLQSAAPSATGVATDASRAGNWIDYCDTTASSTASFYGTTLPCQYFAFQHRGFLYAPQSGPYTFAIGYTDDVLSIWVGDEAVVRSGYTGTNPNLSTKGDHPRQYTYVATVGEYVPVRILLHQVDGPYGETIKVTGPDGTTFLGGDMGARNWVQFACDGSTEAWLPWGKE